MRTLSRRSCSSHRARVWQLAEHQFGKVSAAKQTDRYRPKTSRKTKLIRMSAFHNIPAEQAGGGRP